MFYGANVRSRKISQHDNFIIKDNKCFDCKVFVSQSSVERICHRIMEDFKSKRFIINKY